MSRHVYMTLGRARNLIGVLEEENNGMWELKIVLPVVFEFGYQSEGEPRWTGDEVYDWKQGFINNAKTTWTRRWLIESTGNPNSGLSPRGGRSNVLLPVVNVFLDILEIHGTAQEAIQEDPRLAGRIFTIRIFHTRPDGQRVQSLQHRSSSPITQLNQNDVEIRPTRGGASRQRAADHEVGHMLGLSHTVCEGNESACYGDPGTEAGDDVMGVGQRVFPRDYAVFVEIMERIRPRYGWRVASNWHAPVRAAFRSPSPSVVPASRHA